MRVLLLALTLAFLAARPALAQDGGWTIQRFHADIAISSDGGLEIVETIDVDFGSLQRHGIFREIPIRYAYDDRNDRVYDLSIRSVRDALGAPVRFERGERGANVTIRIGDPDITVSGRQGYRIAYRVAGALNPFPGHDELFWNVNGPDWPVLTLQASATVRMSANAIERSACYQGRAGSTEACRSVPGAGLTQFVASRALSPGEQLTIVAAIRKGVLPEPQLKLRARARTPDQFFDLTPATLSASVSALLGGLWVLGWSWWRGGRDRRYVRSYYLSGDPTDADAPLLDAPTIVPEYEPPDRIRPAQAGVVLDESADPKDATATIVDLAVRGYLSITEIAPRGLFGSPDWTLTRQKVSLRSQGPLPLGPEIRAYERTLLVGLFEGGDEVKLSELKGEFHAVLAEAQKQLYADAVKEGWFPRDPSRVRLVWAWVGLALLAVGLGATVGLGITLGGGIVGLAIALVGIVALAANRAMASRSAKGSELLRRLLGFRRYMETAETDRQRFAEREGIFAEYLPYAIVFGSVTKWARAFEGLDTQKATGSWYVGPGPFSALAFSSSLESFSSSVSSAIASTPGGSGSSSGFSGGSAGGGGGGGGGGSW